MTTPFDSLLTVWIKARCYTTGTDESLAERKGLVMQTESRVNPKGTPVDCQRETDEKPTLADGQPLEKGTAYRWMQPDGILHSRIKTGVEIDRNHARGLVRHVRGLCGGKRPVLSDYRCSQSLTHDAQIRFFAPNDITALAIAAWTRIARAASESLLGTVKAPYPARVFASEEEAVLWLSHCL